MPEFFLYEAVLIFLMELFQINANWLSKMAVRGRYWI